METGLIKKSKNKKSENMSSIPKYHIKTGDIIFEIMNHAFFILFALTCIFPFYYLFINTISANDLVNIGAINFIPRGIQFRNYTMMLEVKDLGQAFKITLLRTVIATVLMVSASGLIGFLVTKNEMWRRKFWYRFIFFSMWAGAGLIPWYMNMSMLGLTDNFLGYILPAIVAPYNIILVKTYIESIPSELEESAYMDGATYMMVFRKIIWPLSKPILATIAIFGAVGNWNSFQDSLILMQNNSSLQTLQHRLWVYLQGANNLKDILATSNGTIPQEVLTQLLDSNTLKYTVSMVTVLPILFIYPFMQRYFEKGIMLGAVKG